jgi:hypothetical protein
MASPPIHKSHYPFFAKVNQTSPIVNALKNFPLTNYPFFANAKQEKKLSAFQKLVR